MCTSTYKPSRKKFTSIDLGESSSSYLPTIFLFLLPFLSILGTQLVNFYQKAKEYDQELGVIKEFEERMDKAEILAKMLLLKASILFQINEMGPARETLERIILNFGSAPEVAIARQMLKYGVKP